MDYPAYFPTENKEPHNIWQCYGYALAARFTSPYWAVATRFAHGRHMMKLVMMMLAQLASARRDETRAALDRRAILLLGFLK